MLMNVEMNTEGFSVTGTKSAKVFLCHVTC